MSERYDYDIIIIGSGPGGYVAAIRASQLGMKTAVIEKEHIGGICLNWGCIPSKSLIHQAELFLSTKELEKMGLSISKDNFNYSSVQKNSRNTATRLSKGVAYLLKKNKVTVISGQASFLSKNKLSINNDQEITGKKIVIATGSSSRTIPGFSFDEKDILSSTGALQLQELPESIAIIGGGAIGVEFSYIFSAFGVKVYIIEMLDQILPFEDNEAVKVIQKMLRKQKVVINTSTKFKSYEKKDNLFNLSLDKNGEIFQVSTEKILIATGRNPNTGGLNLDNIGVKTNNGFITVGDYFQTNIPSIYAIGDVINTPLLAHVASREGEIAVEHIAGLEPDKSINPDEIPSAVYCEPQIASFGITEKIAQEKKLNYKKTLFPYRGAGKSIAINQPEGFVKIIYQMDNKKILGAHIVGKDATEIIHEILLAKKANLLPKDISETIHAHPSLSETIMEAANSIEGKVIHM